MGSGSEGWALWGPQILAALISGAVATAITIYVQARAAMKVRKLDCLRRVVAYRFALQCAEWLAALNEIAVTFNDAPKVMDRLHAFERTIRATGGHRNEELLDLIKQMMHHLRLSLSRLDDEFILRPFGAKSPAGRAVPVEALGSEAAPAREQVGNCPGPG